jgi:hypothetical protein
VWPDMDIGLDLVWPDMDIGLDLVWPDMDIGLDLVWLDMDIGDCLAIAKVVAHYQEARVSVSLKQFGSLYHAPDLDRHPPQSALYTGQKDVQISVTRSIIGPSTGHESVDDGRAGVESDRGPCKASLPRFASLRSDRYFSGGTHWKSSEGRLAMGKCCTLRVSLGSPNTTSHSLRPRNLRSHPA